MFKSLKVLILSLILVIPSAALAIPAYTEDVLILEKDEVINHNYYGAGNIVEIYGTINGDVFVAGNSIVIESENINGDVFAAANNIIIKGKINGSLRIVGQRLDVAAQVDRNIMAFGQAFRLDSQANVNGILSFWGQSASVAGSVARLEGAMEILAITGEVRNDVDVYIASNQAKENIKLSDSALVGGTLYYKALDKLQINENAQVGDIAFNKIVHKEKKDNYSGKVFATLLEFFGMLIIGMIALYAWPSIFKKTYAYVYKKPIYSFFVGLASIILTPIVAILLAVTLIGLPVSIVLMVLWGLALYLVSILAAWILAKLLKDKFLPNKKWSDLLTLALGILVYICVGKIPFLGPIVIALLYMMAWGGFYRLLKHSKENK